MRIFKENISVSLKQPLAVPIVAGRGLHAKYPSVVEAFWPILILWIEHHNLHPTLFSTTHNVSIARRAGHLIVDGVSTHEADHLVGGRFTSSNLDGNILLLARLLLEFALALRRAGLEPTDLMALAALPLDLPARQRKRKCGGCLRRLLDPAKRLFSIKCARRHYSRSALDPLPEPVVHRLVVTLVSAKRTLALASHPKDGLLPNRESLHLQHRRGFGHK